MIKPFKFLSFSVIAAAVLYGGVKGYLYFNIKSELDDAIAMAGPFVHIEYGGIGTGLDGRISIEEVNIFPPGIDDPLRIESLSVQWPHLGYLLSGVRNTPGQALPERMILAVKGAHLPTKGGLADSLRQNLRQAEMTAGRKLPDPCSLQGSFGGEDYAAIGYHELVVDAKLGYELEQSSQELTAQFEFHLHGMQTLSMDITLTGISQPAAMMMGVIPRLKEYTATFQAAPDHVAKVVGYCADRRDQTEGEYIQALVNEIGGGFEPGAGLREAIKRYLENPREIVVRMRPAEPLDVSTLAHYKPEDIVTLLGLQVQVGGEELRDLSFDLALPERHTAAAPGPGSRPGSVPARYCWKSKTWSHRSGRIIP